MVLLLYLDKIRVTVREAFFYRFLVKEVYLGKYSVKPATYSF